MNPLVRIAPQLQEMYQLVLGQNAAQARASASAALQASGLTAAAQHYPWQISGGMAQRAAATIAQAGGAAIVLADEPTKGLDAHWLHHTVQMLQAVQRAGGCVIVITHDLHVAQALGGQLIVLRAGQVMEQGAAHEILAQPRHPFTQALIAAAPQNWPRQPAPAAGQQPLQAGMAATVPVAPHTAEPVLSARGLTKRFGNRTLFENVDLDILPGERLVIQGASGTGKSTLGNVLLGLLPADGGQVQRRPGMPATALQKLYQDPAASFPPHIRLERTLRDVAKRHRYPWPDVLDQLARLGVSPDLLSRLPAHISGGELQRIALARVLITRPALLFADEPTSRLDPITQHNAMQMLLEAARDNNAALVLVTHDQDIARAVATQTLRFGETGLIMPQRQS